MPGATWARPHRTSGTSASPVLILDEAISSLDLPTEHAVHQAMTTLLHGRTTIVIAHRPATVSIADRVLVLVDGHITEDGPRSNLIPVEATRHPLNLNGDWFGRRAVHSVPVSSLSSSGASGSRRATAPRADGRGEAVMPQDVEVAVFERGKPRDGLSRISWPSAQCREGGHQDAYCRSAGCGHPSSAERNPDLAGAVPTVRSLGRDFCQPRPCARSNAQIGTT
jgi:hypothetical protein